jgi:hypothetical protein
MDKVKECRALGDNQFMIVKFDQSTSQMNPCSKIVHRGVVFQIPTCDCGFWCSSFALCLCIARALNANEQKILVLAVENIQLHPLWPQALVKCKRADYDDFPTVKLVVKTSSDNNDQSTVCPNQFFVMNRVPKEDKRYAKLMEVFKELGQVAVNIGNEHTFRLAHARITQAIDDCKTYIECQSQKYDGGEASNGGLTTKIEDNQTALMGTKTRTTVAVQDSGTGTPMPKPPQMPLNTKKKQRARASKINKSKL